MLNYHRLLRAPAFWQSSKRRTAWQALSILYSGGRRLWARYHRRQLLEVPSICIGNAVMGGAGKTPVTMAIAEICQNWAPIHILTRGYGAKNRNTLRVNTKHHDAITVGDEALLLAEVAPTWIGVNRHHSAQQAKLHGAKLVVLDDGLHNPLMRAHVNLLVIDSHYGLGNGRLFPAGPLRRGLKEIYQESDAIILVHSALPDLLTKDDLEGQIVFQAFITHPRMGGRSADPKRFYAVTAIGQPEKFFAALRAQGHIVAGTEVWGDHYRWQPHQIETILAKADRLNARPIITAKDAVRLDQQWKKHFTILPMKLDWRGDKKHLKHFLRRRLTPWLT